MEVFRSFSMQLCVYLPCCVKFHRYKVSVYNDAAHLNRQVFFRKLAHECNSFQNSYFVQLLHFKEIKFCTISLRRRANASGRIDKNRRKIETVRPFEPSSTIVHPCTSQPMYVHVHRLRTSFVPKLVSDLSHAHPWAH